MKILIIYLAKKHNLIVIEDAAHSLGAEYKGKKIGSIGDMAEFSFHPVKHITRGEGGVITTDSKDYYNKLIMFRTHGITKDNKLMKSNETWYYKQQFLGYNYRMTDIQASLGISQLKKLDYFIGKRIEVARKYDEAFKDIEVIKTPMFNERNKHVWHLYVIQVNFDEIGLSREDFCKELKSRNIGTNVHDIPVYLHPYYKKIGYEAGMCPNSERYIKI